MTDLADLNLSEASELLAQRHISSSELVRAVLERMDDTEPSVHAYVSRCDEVALAHAEQADRGPRRGPLHGIPFAVKDTLHTIGAPTEASSALRRGAVSSFDATAVARLRQAGAILIGKHTTHEFALGFDSPPTRNPWDVGRFAGGSSSGGGASVAVGSAMLALGTDAGGSTRMPAALTGVVGLKPTYGLISTYGTVPGAAVPGVEHIGLFTRTAADAALVLPSVSGPDLNDRRTVDLPPFVLAVEPGTGLRIGVIHEVCGAAAPDSSVAANLDRAAGVFAALGASVFDIELPLSTAEPTISLIVASNAAASHLVELRERPELFSPDVRAFLRAAVLTPAQHVHSAHAARTALRRRIAAIYNELDLDLVITPTVGTGAPLLSGFMPTQHMAPLTSFTCPWNLTGQPAISLPSGLDHNGMPTAIQLVGRPLAESTLLRAAIAYQDSTNWHRERPTMSRRRQTSGG